MTGADEFRCRVVITPGNYMARLWKIGRMDAVGDGAEEECVRQRVPGAGCEVQDAGCRMQNAEYRIQGAGRRMSGAGCRIQDAGNGLGGDGQSVTLK